MAVRHRGQFKAKANSGKRKVFGGTPPTIEGLQQVPAGFALSLQTMSPELVDFSGIGGDDKERPAILKIQHPLESSTEAGMHQCLVYNKTRSVHYYIPLDDTVRKLFTDQSNPQKIYVRAHLVPDGVNAFKFRVIEHVEPQPW